MSRTKYLKTNVLEEARKRIAMIFDDFEKIVVSISGGKDSTVLCYLALLEAEKRGRKISLFFLDEEVVYKNTIEQVQYLMNLKQANTIRLWYQIPFNLTNATSLNESFLRCWEKSVKKKWMRKRRKDNVIRQNWSHETKIANKNIGLDFYDVIKNIELSYENTAILVGLRAVESPNRWRTMVKNPGYKNVYWSTKKGGSNYSFYPIYDWNTSDIWKYIGEQGLKYHKYYDFCFLKGVHPHLMRISSLIHEKSFKSIQDLPEFEPDTYEKLLDRISGISFCQETGKDKKVFKVRQLPKNYKTWKEYRDFLLLTYPDKSKKSIFERRFSNHYENEFVARQQCRQLVLNDYENNLPVDNKLDPVQEKIELWRKIL